MCARACARVCVHVHASTQMHMYADVFMWVCKPENNLVYPLQELFLPILSEGLSLAQWVKAPLERAKLARLAG